MRAQVLFGANNIYTVVDDQGGRFLCRLKGKRIAGGGRSHAPLAPGDWVEISVHAPGEGMIGHRLPRRNVLRRQGKNIEEQVIAANIDQVLVMSSLQDPRPHPELINRFLLLGQSADIPTILLFNKIDLPSGEQCAFLRHRWHREFNQACSKVLFSSVTHASEKEWTEITTWFSGRTTAVIGNSGVGKSSLINRLLGHPFLATSTISPSGRRGTHTTTRATMIEGHDWRLIDTPGVRTLIPLVALHQLESFFPEFSPHLGQCQFNRCSHLHEPACAVRQALKFGAIPLPRYQCYQRVYSACAERNGAKAHG